MRTTPNTRTVPRIAVLLLAALPSLAPDARADVPLRPPSGDLRLHACRDAPWDPAVGLRSVAELSDGHADVALRQVEQLHALATAFTAGPTLALPDEWTARAASIVATPRPLDLWNGPLDRLDVRHDRTLTQVASFALGHLGPTTLMRRLDWPGAATLRRDAPGSSTVLLAGMVELDEPVTREPAWMLVRYLGPDAVAIVTLPTVEEGPHHEFVRTPRVVVGRRMGEAPRVCWVLEAG